MVSHMFYNGRSENAKLVHKGILLVSDPHTHVETKFSDGMSWSSEFGVGPRFKDITYSHPERWTEVKLPFITPEMEREMRYKAELWVKLREAGFTSYDSRGAVGCLHSGKEDPWDLFCSEGCYDIMPHGLILPKINHRMYPQRLLEVDRILNELNKEK